MIKKEYVLNDQADFLCKQKEIVLQDKCLKEKLKEAAAELTADIIQSFAENALQDFVSPLRNLVNNLYTKLNYWLVVDLDNDKFLNTELLTKCIVNDLEREVEERERIIGPANLNSFIRDIYMRIIDTKWTNYLDKYRGAEVFDEMAAETRKEAASKFFLMPRDLFWKYNECFRIV
jgi:preprotein translocase subunit SecA